MWECSTHFHVSYRYLSYLFSSHKNCAEIDDWSIVRFYVDFSNEISDIVFHLNRWKKKAIHLNERSLFIFIWDLFIWIKEKRNIVSRTSWWSYGYYGFLSRQLPILYLTRFRSEKRKKETNWGGDNECAWIFYVVRK